MKKISAGLLVYRMRNGEPEVFIVHNGGPFFAKKDNGAWNLPKGLIEEGEDALNAAKREFVEETGFGLPSENYIDIGEITYPKGDKKVIVWAVEGDFEAGRLKSNTFELQWPPRSGKTQEFPEIDRGEWFTLQTASKKLFPPLLPFLERLADHLNTEFHPGQRIQPSEQGSLF